MLLTYMYKELSPKCVVTCRTESTVTIEQHVIRNDSVEATLEACYNNYKQLSESVQLG